MDSILESMSKQFGFYVARAYDESFRKVRKLLNFDWAVVNDDLWRTAFYDQYKPSQNSNNKNLGKVNKQRRVLYDHYHDSPW